jgi:undecaprenyl diphosphate synthase
MEVMKMLKIDYDSIPNHIAIIMDGNGRWAKKRLVSKSIGHKTGADTLKKIIESAEEIGISYLTAFAFSTENWNRSDSEVAAIMKLLREYIDKYIEDVHNNNIKMTIIGNINALDIDLQEKSQLLMDMTRNKTGINVIIAINYGGRDEITRATHRIINDINNGKLKVNQITENCISNYLDTKDVPDPDLLIRTSGEMRISNFMLWQLAYSEIYFSNKLWPDFNKNDLLEAISFYQKRDRRFGAR